MTVRVLIVKEGSSARQRGGVEAGGPQQEDEEQGEGPFANGERRAPRSRSACDRRSPASDRASFITFPTLELLCKVITPKRLDILRALAGKEALSIRGVARRLGRDLKAVHGDVHALVDAGLLELAEGGVRFGYDAVHVDFTLRAA